MQPSFQAIFTDLGAEFLARIAFSYTRYLFIAGGIYLLLYVWKYKAWFRYKIQKKAPLKKLLYHDFFWSSVSRILFVSAGMFIAHYSEYSQLYMNISDRGWLYLGFSVIIFIVVHDTYFYWLHRLIHHPKLYAFFHRTHHKTTNPTPLSAFAFHPAEAVLEMAILPLLVFVFPMHLVTIIISLGFQLLFNIYLHSGFEFLPKFWVRHPVLKYINTSVHHNLHHNEFYYNYGLYFNFWDRWMGTLDPYYIQKFEMVKAKSEQPAMPMISPDYTTADVSKKWCITDKTS